MIKTDKTCQTSKAKRDKVTLKTHILESSSDPPAKTAMEIPPQNVNLCMVCLNNANLSCTMCYNVHYCSPEHQMQHLPVHRAVCTAQCTSTSSAQMDTFQSYLGDMWSQNNLPVAKPDDLGLYQPVFEANPPTADGQSFEDDLLSSLTSEFLSSDNNLWDLINSCNADQDLFSDSNFIQKDPEPEEEQNILNKKVLNLMGGASFQSICSNISDDLDKYGICVLDKFLGETLGNLILDEVTSLYSRGVFRKGQLVMPNPHKQRNQMPMNRSLGDVRTDVTAWVNGTERECLYVGHLMQLLDVIMATCNKSEGVLSRYKLHTRTKAMIACYPGDGTHYKKHIDNPHRDGRCVTCIYYLNKNWDTEKDGGMLRMFPSIMEDDVAEIEPIFDRMIFFWSDKRNPHEVLRAFRTRFAITVWYFDADERDRALMRLRERANPTSQ